MICKIFSRIIIETFVLFLFLILIAIFLLSEQAAQHLLCYRAFAVKDHSFIPCALHLQQPRLVNNSG